MAHLEIRGFMSTHLLFHLQLVNYGGQLRQNLVCLLVVFELGCNEVGEVAEGFWGVEDLEVHMLAISSSHSYPPSKGGQGNNAHSS